MHEPPKNSADCTAHFFHSRSSSGMKINEYKLSKNVLKADRARNMLC